MSTFSYEIDWSFATAPFDNPDQVRATRRKKGWARTANEDAVAAEEAALARVRRVSGAIVSAPDYEESRVVLVKGPWAGKPLELTAGAAVRLWRLEVFTESVRSAARGLPR